VSIVSSSITAQRKFRKSCHKNRVMDTGRIYTVTYLLYRLKVPVSASAKQRMRW